MPCRMLGNCRVARVVGDNVDGDLGGPEILHIGLVGYVLVGQAVGLLDRLGGRAQQNIERSRVVDIQ